MTKAVLPLFVLLAFTYYIAMLRRLQNHLPAANYAVALVAVYHKIVRRTARP